MKKTQPFNRRLFMQMVGKSNGTHRMSRTPVGWSWQGMMNRCYNKKQPWYAFYGAVGIIVCEFLRASPQNLLLLLGERPKGTTIDRMDNIGSYTCGQCAQCLERGFRLNVRWATYIQQARNKNNNRMITVGGKTKCLAAWGEETGINTNTILWRLKNGCKSDRLFDPVLK